MRMNERTVGSPLPPRSGDATNDPETAGTVFPAAPTVEKVGVNGRHQAPTAARGSRRFGAGGQCQLGIRSLKAVAFLSLDPGLPLARHRSFMLLWPDGGLSSFIACLTVMTTAINLRKDPRVEFFLVPVDREQVPVWVFKPETDSTAHAGVVANVSRGGLQVLTLSDAPLNAQHYEVKLLLDEDEGVPPFKGPVRRIWTESLTSLINTNGFEFEVLNSSAEQFLAAFKVSAHQQRWVRCVLLPLHD